MQILHNNNTYLCAHSQICVFGHPLMLYTTSVMYRVITRVISLRAHGDLTKDGSEADSDEENDEGDYTVFECPGLAPVSGTRGQAGRLVDRQEVRQTFTNRQTATLVLPRIAIMAIAEK